MSVIQLIVTDLTLAIVKPLN